MGLDRDLKCYLNLRLQSLLISYFLLELMGYQIAWYTTAGFISTDEWIDGWVYEQRNKLDGWRKLQQARLRLIISSVQLLSRVWLFGTPWTIARQASLSITNSWSLLKLMSIESIQPSHPLSSPSPPAFNLFQHQGLFKWVSSCIRWPKYWSFSFNISPSNEYPGLISLSMNWLDLLAVQGTLKGLLQHHSSKALILWCSGFFINI